MSISTSENKRSLIINADDFGLNPEVNQGILKAYQEGVVTSTSLLVNREGFSDALQKIKENPGLDVGIHLNCLRGKPLTSEDHFVPSLFWFVLKYFIYKKKMREEIGREFEAQIQKALQEGVKISHLDCEKHLQTLPFIFEIVLKLAQKYQIPCVRLPFEAPTRRAFKNPRQLFKILGMTLFSKKNERLLKKSPIQSPERLYGVALSSRFSLENLKGCLKCLGVGVSELSCHPGFFSKEASSYIDKEREKELETLLNPDFKKFLNEEGILLISYETLSRNTRVQL